MMKMINITENNETHKADLVAIRPRKKTIHPIKSHLSCDYTYAYFCILPQYTSTIACESNGFAFIAFLG